VSEDLYPTMLWDSEEVRRCRIHVQKPWSREEFWSFYFSRRISIYISLFIAKKTGVSPNAITCAGIAAGLVAAAAFMYGSAMAFLIGCLCYQFSYLADCVDGEVARITKKKSSGGEWLDIALNYSLYFSSFGVVYGVTGTDPKWSPLLIFVILFTIFAEILSSNGSSLVFGHGKVSQKTVSARKGNKWLDAGVFLLLTQTGFQLGVFLGSLVWAMTGQLQLLYGWTAFHLLVGLARVFYKLKMNIKYVLSSLREGGDSNEGTAHGSRSGFADQRAN
jgi:phosphatidylglycerophosphate synthase